MKLDFRPFSSKNVIILILKKCNYFNSKLLQDTFWNIALCTEFYIQNIKIDEKNNDISLFLHL